MLYPRDKALSRSLRATRPAWPTILVLLLEVCAMAAHASPPPMEPAELRFGRSSNGGHPPPQQTHSVQNVQLEMSDGVHLNTDVYFPDQGAGPWPVLLYRTPYNIQGDNLGGVVDLGYAVVCQDTRGRWGSEGLDRMFLDDGWGPDHEDGLETTRWIVAQPWCNGRIATYGSSARGITQNMLAGAYPESVRCMSVYVAPEDLYRDLIFPGGAFRKYDIEGWLTGQGSTHMLDSIYVHPNHDEFWSWLDTRSRHASETIPTFQYGGWFDLFPKGTIGSFTGKQYGGGSGAAGNQKLIMGPWTHGMDPNQAGQLTFPNAGLEHGEALIGGVLDWLNYWIMDIPNGIMQRPPIAYYLMGDVSSLAAPGNLWKTSEVWPPPSTTVPFYLNSGSALHVTPPSAPQAPDAFAYDPANPVPTLGGGNLILQAGSYDQRPVLNRADVLVYKSPVLTQPVEVVGDITVELFVSSDRLDTDFTAKLCDVYPDGRVMLICDGILRARHRIGMHREDFLVPGEVVPVSIDLWETAIVFNTGHRILVAVSSSNAPRFDANPNTGEPFLQNTTTLVAHNVVYHEPGRASRLLLPVTGPVPVAVPESPDGSPTAGSGTVVAARLTALGPNPFSNETSWRFTPRLSGHAQVSATHTPAARDGLTACIVDCNGRRVRHLDLGSAGIIAPHAPGGASGASDLLQGVTVTWDGRDDNGRPTPAGVYRCVVACAGERTSSAVVRIW